MPSKGYQLESTTLLRRCLACGTAVEDDALQVECHDCGCDFLERPPRSYAEMEAIEEPITAVSPPLQAWSAWREQVLVERWIWFLFGVGLLVVVSMLTFLI
ncbi:MAG: hypothetical protein MK085_09955 [Phycisphaerales bacterium]|nr:hypothetical protein [Phycisphaerales bacterium]